MAKPKWAKASWYNHQEYIRRANLKGLLKDDAEVINFLTLAMCGEMGEFANLIKKMWRGDGVDTKKLHDELADIRIYMQHLSEHLDINLDAACETKVIEVHERLNQSRDRVDND